jgi:cytochrome c-type biogenesis protein CcmH
MIALWIAAALFSALASTLIVYRAARAAAAAREPAEDPALAVYRRQLSEIDDLAERGLLPRDEHRSAHAEAARRLLSAADQPPPPSPAAESARRLVVVAAAATPLIAAALYLTVGSPRTPDQPFAKRLAAWRAADPATLSPPQLAALLSLAVARYPNDANPLYYLARAQAASGDMPSAEHNLRKAIQLAPRRADLWSALGAMLASEPGGEDSPDAVSAFRQAHALDPGDPDARYFLARSRIASGDVDGGLGDWRALIADLKVDDPRKAFLVQQAALVEKTRALPVDDAPAQGSDAAQVDTQAFIRAMVAQLAARLRSQPDDPAGWARLIRAYAVLGDKPSQAAALARARTLFKDRPADLRRVDTAEGSAQ